VSTEPATKTSLPLALFIAVILYASLPHITTDIYLPSLPAIAEALASTATAVKLTITSFMLGFGIAHLIYGPISDRIGRRKPILFGIGLSTLGTFLCLYAPTISVLIMGRFLQGVGVAACNSVGRSLMRDLLSGVHFAKISSHLGMTMILVIATAPTLGGYIQYYFNWQTVFIVLLGYTIFVWLFSWKALPETHLAVDPHATQLKTVLHNYRMLLAHPIFMGYTLCVSLAYAGIVAYITCSPFLFQSVIGQSATQFGWLAFVTGFAIFLSFYINGKIVLQHGIEKMILAGIFLMLGSGILMLLLGLYWVNTFVILLPATLFFIGVGFTFANATAGAFQPFPHMAGATGGLFGCLQILGGALSSFGIAFLPHTNQIPLAIVFIGLNILALLCFFVCIHRSRLTV